MFQIKIDLDLFWMLRQGQADNEWHTSGNTEYEKRNRYNEIAFVSWIFVNIVHYSPSSHSRELVINYDSTLPFVLRCAAFFEYSSFPSSFCFYTHGKGIHPCIDLSSKVKITKVQSTKGKFSRIISYKSTFSTNFSQAGVFYVSRNHIVTSLETTY